ncbi:MAG: helicase-related protein [Polyangiales bacterium]
MTAPPAPSAAVRSHLVDALHADLVGPFDGDPSSTEVLRLPPSRFYLTGFLAPSGDRVASDPTDDEDFAAGSDSDDDEQSEASPEPKVPKLLPASIGLSVLLPPGEGDAVQVTLHYAEYLPGTADETPEGRTRPPQQWQRLPRRPVKLRVALDATRLAKGEEIPGSDGLWLEGRLVVADAPGLAAGTRALSLFVVNHRKPVTDAGRGDMAFVFQVSLELRHERGLVARPNRRDEPSDDLDDRVADLQFRDCVEWAVGHGAAAETLREGERVVGARTVWIPRAEVRPVASHDLPSLPTEMDALADAPDGATLRTQLRPLVEAYGAWIEARRAVALDSDRRRETRDLLLDEAARANARVAEGLDLLAAHDDLFAAFVLANRAMALQARKRDPDRYKNAPPRWRLFQLAFLLLNVAGLHDPTHADRERVELIFFPTGGGKTEAYLGVIAFALALRRLRGRSRPDGGYGVTVVLRYTLRLLTLDQLQRAATLVCALETLRRADPARLGEVRFSVGLWVGRTATANTLAEVSEKITTWKQQRDSKTAPSPLPLTHCPWCGFELTPDCATLQPSKSAPTHVQVLCRNFRSCDFGQGAKGYTEEGLPLVFVDEQVYRELPSFLVATVDKFAMVPWRAEAGMLFGRVHSREGRRFFGTPDGPTAARSAEVLPEGLRPPELIVQDELHLISGPLGTMVGLYETAIEALCGSTAPMGRASARSCVASTATVRRSRRQILSLFGRDAVSLPPPGIDEGDTFFARVDRSADGRLYLGVAAGGRAMKAVLLRVYVTLLTAAWHQLGGAKSRPRRPPTRTPRSSATSTRCASSAGCAASSRTRFASAAPRSASGEPRMAGRRAVVPRGSWANPSSSPRARGRAASAARARLKLTHDHDEHVDVLLASGMISVGVDIDRLGLMVVAGQPKTTSEYIQATSRVGRRAKWPGLVVTALNLHKPRDRSHYERFTAWHSASTATSRPRARRLLPPLRWNVASRARSSRWRGTAMVRSSRATG